MIRALHGFLGRPSDWDFLRYAGFEVDAVDLFGSDPLESLQSLSRKAVGDLLLGYSMGGRIALEALLQPNAVAVEKLWSDRLSACRRVSEYKAAIIVSAGLNLEDERERASRRAADEQWARRFELEPWPELLRSWNAQPVFGGHESVRIESDFDRHALAEALRGWSPGTRPPLAPRLHEIDMPILWIAGARDAKYVAAAERAVALLPRAELWICPDSGHRVPWEQPARFIDRLHQFIGRET